MQTTIKVALTALVKITEGNLVTHLGHLPSQTTLQHLVESKHLDNLTVSKLRELQIDKYVTVDHRITYRLDKVTVELSVDCLKGYTAEICKALNLGQLPKAKGIGEFN